MAPGFRQRPHEAGGPARDGLAGHVVFRAVGSAAPSPTPAANGAPGRLAPQPPPLLRRPQGHRARPGAPRHCPHGATATGREHKLRFQRRPLLAAHLKNFHSSKIHLKLIFYACAKDPNP